MTEIPTTLGALAAAAPALSRLAAQPLPITAAYAVAKVTKLAADEIDLFTAQRNALIKELGTERDASPADIANGATGRVVEVKPEHAAAYVARLDELAAVAVVLPCAPIDPATLGAITIAPGDLIVLGALIRDPV